MKTFKNYFSEAAVTKLSKKEETTFWNAIGLVVDGMRQSDEDAITKIIQNSKPGEVTMVPVIKKAIGLALKEPKTFDKAELAVLKKVGMNESALAEAKLPRGFITDIRVEPEIIDEWYGVTIRFKWGKGGQPNMDEEKLVELIAAEAKKSSQYRKFRNWAKKASVTADSSSIDASPRDVMIPDFDPRDYSDWGFDGAGGWISASDR